MFVAGCDYSTFAADFVLLPLEGDSADGASWWRIPLRLADVPLELEAFHAAVALSAVLLKALPWPDIACLYVETPVLGVGGALTTVKQARIQGAIVASVPPSVTVGEIHPGSWKKGIGLSGNASKAAVMQKVLDMGFRASRPKVLGQGPEDTDVQDAYDAFGIAWTVRNELRREVERVVKPLEMPAF
jgi:hypothetical protein